MRNPDSKQQPASSDARSYVYSTDQASQTTCYTLVLGRGRAGLQCVFVTANGGVCQYSRT